MRNERRVSLVVKTDPSLSTFARLDPARLSRPPSAAVKRSTEKERGGGGDGGEGCQKRETRGKGNCARRSSDDFVRLTFEREPFVPR